jgi:transcriptional regulatory protein LEU3
LRPKFLHLLNENEQDEIVRDVDRLIDVLRSKGVALDGRHTPALYSRFLSSLLDKHNSRIHRSLSDSPPHDHNIHPAHHEAHQPPQSYLYSWPDIVHPEVGPENAEIPASDFYNHDEAEMDFSLSHFVRTVTAQDLPTQNTEGQLVPQVWNDWELRNNQVQWPPVQPLHFPGMWRP